MSGVSTTKYQFNYEKSKLKTLMVSDIIIYLFILTVPSDVYEPKKHVKEELDALKIPQDKRDSCKDYYAEFKKCIAVQHNTKMVFNWKYADKDNCGYYFDHWNYCHEK